MFIASESLAGVRELQPGNLGHRAEIGAASDFLTRCSEAATAFPSVGQGSRTWASFAGLWVAGRCAWETDTAWCPCALLELSSDSGKPARTWKFPAGDKLDTVRSGVPPQLYISSRMGAKGRVSRQRGGGHSSKAGTKGAAE